MPAQQRTRPGGKLPKGLVTEDLKIGEGLKAGRGSRVDLRYEIRSRRGEVIAEGTRRDLILGSRRAIAGLERGIEGMQVGGIRRLIVPPHLAYRDGRRAGLYPRRRRNCTAAATVNRHPIPVRIAKCGHKCSKRAPRKMIPRITSMK